MAITKCDYEISGAVTHGGRSRGGLLAVHPNPSRRLGPAEMLHRQQHRHPIKLHKGLGCVARLQSDLLDLPNSSKLFAYEQGRCLSSLITYLLEASTPESVGNLWSTLRDDPIFSTDNAGSVCVGRSHRAPARTLPAHPTAPRRSVVSRPGDAKQPVLLELLQGRYFPRRSPLLLELLRRWGAFSATGTFGCS